MTIRLYDTATREVRDFVPLQEGKAGLYVCGLTVQSEPHVGHVRSGVNFDVLQRWLRFRGYDVTFIRNITDIDDKILTKAAEQGRPWYNLAYAMKLELDRAYAALNVAPPTYEPAATGHVPEMITLIAELIDRGHAYPAEDGSGDVYFDVRSWADYGELTKQGIDDMEPAGDADPRGKKDPRDFALWKGRKDSEPETASWPSPWGPGRPGWHIECSAMAGKYLGPAFDIHGGGVDLRFPHHENEQAQSRAAGGAFASYWMHNAWITTAGEKMSKSLGNTLSIPSVLQRVRGAELRFYMVAAHYRSHVEFSFEALDEAAQGYRRIESFLERAGVSTVSTASTGSTTGAVSTTGAGSTAGVSTGSTSGAGSTTGVSTGSTTGAGSTTGVSTGSTSGAGSTTPVVELVETVPEAFAAAMDDDLGTPAAVAVLYDTVREGNRQLAAGEDPSATVAAVGAMLDVLGLHPQDPAWAATGNAAGAEDKLKAAVDALVAGLLEERTQARADKDWSRADAIRDRIKAAGIEVTDTPDGPTWTVS